MIEALAGGLSSNDTSPQCGGFMPRFSEDPHLPSIAGLGVQTVQKPDDNVGSYGAHKYRKDPSFQIQSSEFSQLNIRNK